MQFLMGFNESYSQTCSQILMMEPLPSISTAFSLVIQEERQRQINSGPSLLPGSIAVAESSSPASIFAANFTQKTKRDRPLCTHCGIQGHTVDKCYKLHGYPPGYKPRSKNSEMKIQANQMSVNTNTTAGHSPRSASSALDTLTTDQCQ